ncbi:MAG: protein kinase [Deltaproteobacteria bacterium]|nr:protein kinase [Deltaproteobacteria bacterium]
MTDGASGSFPQAPPAPSLVGQVLDGRYRIVKLIGEGGMGEVYAAEHVHIEKRFAIKLLKQEIVSNAEAVTRFRQEARSSSSIGHRNIIAIEDFGQLNDGRIYMCMELLNGAALNDLIQQPMGADRLLNILIQTGHGLAAAHAKGIVHRDMKPENIFVTIDAQGQDVPKILDFGIAKVSGNDGGNHLTRTGTIFGTPFYMAPEQALGNPVDARTDIYAMGVIMYECFAGSLPFQGESFMGILTQHITSEPEPVAQRAAKAGRALPMGLAEIITRCMQKNPDQRYRTMDELVNALIGVYRQIAGAGMSTYMEAFPVGSSQHMSQPTPPPPMMSGGHAIAPTMAAAPSMTPPAGMVGASSSGLYDPSGSIVTVPKKSSVGLIIAILVVLAAGGGIAAFVLLQKKDDGPKQNQDNGSAVAVVTPNDKGSAAVVTPPVTVDAAPAGKDPWTNGSAGTTNGSSATVETPPKKDTIPVVIDTQPYLSDFEIWENGARLQDGNEPVDVEKGSTRTLTIKRKGFKDATITIDGSKKRVAVKVAAVGGGTHIVITPPPGQKDCSKTLLDRSDAKCQKQFCASHPDDPICGLE